MMMQNPYVHTTLFSLDTKIHKYINVCPPIIHLFTISSFPRPFIVHFVLIRFPFIFHILCKKKKKKRIFCFYQWKNYNFHATSTTPNLAKLANVVGSPGCILRACR